MSSCCCWSVSRGRCCFLCLVALEHGLPPSFGVVHLHRLGQVVLDVLEPLLACRMRLKERQASQLLRPSPPRRLDCFSLQLDQYIPQCQRGSRVKAGSGHHAQREGISLALELARVGAVSDMRVEEVEDGGEGVIERRERDEERERHATQDVEEHAREGEEAKRLYAVPLRHMADLVRQDGCKQVLVVASDVEHARVPALVPVSAVVTALDGGTHTTICEDGITKALILGRSMR